jgi:ABC-2 type transport system permease protein
VRGFLHRLTGGRVFALFLKELRQIGRNRRLVASLVVPPTLQILVFGFALSPEVHDLRLGVADESRTAESRELVSTFSESNAFRVTGFYASSDALARALDAGDLDAGLVVPYDFAKSRARRATAEVQLLVDAVDSNKAEIAAGYAAAIIAALNARLAAASPPVVAIELPPLVVASDSSAVAAAPPLSVNVARAPLARAGAAARVTLFYNPGLRDDWFIITGIIGVLLILNGSLVAAAAMVKEKEAGTVEQLLMTPAGGTEIVFAKVAPLFLLLSLDIWLALGVGHFVFGVPVRGSLLLLFVAGLLCIAAGIGVGTFLATFSRSQQQAQLMGFFVNPPLALLSGAMTPVEAMPHWLQPFTYLNPVRHFAIISRGVMLKGVGLEVLYPYFLALAGIAALLVGVSVWRFRRQLS